MMNLKTLVSTAATCITSVAFAGGDLVVDSVIAPTSADEAGSVEISWTVRNAGDATISGSWSDKVLLSEDAAAGDDRFLGGFSFDGTLAPGESYTQSEVLLLPQGVVGDQWAVVEADAGDFITEDDESNNTSVSAMPIDITPLYADLVVIAIEVSPTAFNTWDETITVSWTVENQGTAPASQNRYDRIYFSPDAVAGDDLYSGSEEYINLSADPQAPGESRTYSKDFRPYSTFGGDGYMVMQLDRANQENEGPDGETNDFIDDEMISVGTPDLVVTSLDVSPDPLYPGALVTISWTVENQGTGTCRPYNAPYDYVYLSTDAIGGNEDDVYLLYDNVYSDIVNADGVVENDGMQPGESYTVTRTYNLSDSQALGDYTMFIRLDYSDHYYELPGEDDPWFGTPITVAEVYPDLVVTDITMSTSTFNTWDETITVSWTVENQGTAPASQNRYDRIYFSPDAVAGDDLYSGSEEYINLSADPQAPGESRTYSKDFRPYSTFGGDGYMVMQLDRANQENEGPDGETNDFIDDEMISVGTPDLVVTSLDISPDPLYPGALVTISWTVENQGTGTCRPYNAPYDYVYLSTDAIGGNEDDVYLLYDNVYSDIVNADGVVENDGMQPGESYTVTRTYNLSDSQALGDYTMFIRLDYSDHYYELPGEDDPWFGTPITVAEVYPDLVVTDITMSTSTFNTWDETITVSWTVENQGSAPATQNRYDRIYFSPDAVAGDDLYSGSEEYINLSADPQAPGESRTYSKDFRPYSTFGGDGYMVMQLDRANQENEGPDGETNDFIDDEMISVGTPDLVVTSLDVSPDPLYPGALVTISWTVENQGTGTCRPYNAPYDYVYLSTDAIGGNEDDVYLLYDNVYSDIVNADGVVENDGMQPGESYTVTRTYNLSDSQALGDYTMFIRLDYSDHYYELPGEDDPWFGTPITVAEVYPDLVVTDITMSTSTFNTWDETITVSWTVENQGAAPASQNRYDRIYFSPDAVAGDDLYSGSEEYINLSADPQAPGESRTYSKDFRPYSTFGGDGYMVMQLDRANQENEGPDGEANDFIDDEMISVGTPDLYVIDFDTDLNYPSSPGDSVTFTWTVYNGGNGTCRPYNAPYDYVYLSTDAIGGNEDDVYLLYDNVYSDIVNADGVVENDGMQPGESYTVSRTTTLSSSLPPGVYYVLVRLDYHDYYYEVPGDDDPWYVRPPAGADLVVATITVPSKVEIGQTIPVTWTVRNDGATPAEGPWFDEFLLSDDLNVGGDISLGSFAFNGTLGAGETYEQTEMVTVPLEAAGVNFFLAYTDAGSSVEELNESNNILASDDEFETVGADLVVTASSAPGSVTMGSPFTVDFTVANEGTSTVDGWVDGVVFSADDTYDLGDPLVANADNLVELAPKESYKQSIEVTIPTDGTVPSGSGYLIVITDFGNLLLELNDGNNLGDALPINVTQPALPDLVASSIIFATLASVQEPLEIQWTTENLGDANAKGSWREQIEIAPVGDPGSSSILGYWTYSGPLDAGASAARSRSVTLPQMEGEFIITVALDANGDIDEADGEANNRADAAQTLTINAANLVASAITATGPFEQGVEYTVDFEGMNDGLGESWGSGWYDRIYLSSDTLLDKGDVQLASRSRDLDGLAPGEGWIDSATIEVSDAVPLGSYYLILSVDDTGVRYESDETDNELASKSTFDVIKPSRPNLVVSNIDVPETGTTSETISISWTVENAGSTEATESWSDRLFVSTDSRAGGDAIVATVEVPGPLPPGGSTKMSATYVLPEHPTSLWFVVETDVYDDVEEVAGEVDNTSSAFGPIVIEYPPAPDLVVTTASGPTSAESDSIITISWTSCNNGDAPVDGLWRDRVYLSDDMAVGDDLLVGEFVRSEAIDPAQCPGYSGQVVIPLDVVGTRYLVIETDALNDIYEAGNEKNNHYLAPTPLEFTEPALPDLLITAISMPATAEAGSEISVAWDGSNDGDAASGSTWSEEVYLSLDDKLSGSDTLLASRLHVGAASAGETWSEEAMVTLPETAGEYFVLVVTDAGDLIEEGTGEANNVGVSASTITVTELPRPDLVVAITSAPTEATAGDTVEISWTVTNDGAATSVGGWSDAVYLSDDDTFGAGDELLRLQPYNLGPIDPLGGYGRTEAIVLPTDYVGGTKYLLVLADFNAELDESDETNNAAASSALDLAVTPAADLAVSDVLVSSSGATFGGTVELSFTVANVGDMDAVGPWTDFVLISVDDKINTGDLPVATVVYDGDPIVIGGDIVQFATAELPLTNDYPEGEYRLIVVADAANALDEPDEENNQMASAVFTIERPPLGDLAVSVSGMPADVAPGIPFDVTLTFSNAGAEAIDGNWFTAISVTSSEDVTPVLLQDFITAGTIPSGGSLNVKRSISLPDTGEVDVVLEILTDSRDTQIEADENNNGYETTPVPYRRPDLVAVSVSLPAEAIAGDVISVTIEGENIGTAATFGFWTDVVSLSSDTAVGSDRVLAATTFTDAVSEGATYARTFDVTIPDDLEGTFYPVLSIDPADTLHEIDDENADLIDLRATIEITQPDRPNLVASNIVVPGSVIAGAQFEVSFTVENLGPADAGGSWIDRVWASQNSTLSSQDLSLAELLRPSTLAVGEQYLQTATVTAPTTPGSWLLIVQTDAGDTVLEEGSAGEADNVTVAGTSIIVQEVVVTASFVEDEIQLGEAFTIEGSATVSGSGDPATGAPVRVQATLQGFPTELTATTDRSGEFSIEWSPNANAAGTAGVSAAGAEGAFGDVLDQAVVWGLEVSASPTSLDLPQDGVASGVLEITNLGDVPVYGVAITVQGTVEGLNVEVFLQGSDVLAPFETREALITASATDVEVGTFEVVLTVESDEVNDTPASVWLGVVEAIPTLVATPSILQRDMLVGETTYVDITIRNVGYAATNALDVLISEVDWLDLVSPPVMDPLEPGDEAIVQLRLSPPADLLQGPYTASPGIVVVDQIDAAVGVGVNTIFNATSTSFAAIEVNATSEFSYYGKPPTYPEATVEVTRQADDQLVATGQVDADGFIRFDRLEPGFYTVAATAESHGSFTTTVNAQGGQTTAIEAFMSRNLVSYVWEVIPIDFEDEYIITLTLQYETNVPAPVIVIDPIVIDYSAMEQPTEYIELDVTNYGLITAQNFTWDLSNTSRFEIIPLAGAIGDIPPGQTITAPFLMVDNQFADGIAGAHCAPPALAGEHELICGITIQLYRTPIGMIGGNGCGSTPCVDCGGGGGPGGGGGGGSGGGGGPGGTNGPGSTVSITACCAIECIRDIALAGLGCHPASGAAGTAVGWLNAASGGLSGLANQALTSGFGPVGKCICSVGSAISSCRCLFNGESSSGGGICGSGFGFLDGPTEDHREAWAFPEYEVEHWAEQQLLDEIRDLYHAHLPLLYQLGASEWEGYEAEEGELQLALILAIADAVLEDGDGGQSITAAEATAIYALDRAEILSDELVEYFIERWNRSVDYWANGWTTVADVPDGYTTDFIDLEVVGEFNAQALTVLDGWTASGYEWSFEATNDALDIYIAAAEEGQGACVAITVEIEQRVMLVRQAFAANLEIINDSEIPIEGIRVELDIEDSFGEDASTVFAILGPEVEGMSDVDGSGALDAGASGTASWTLVPGDSAAPESVTAYWISGEIVYTFEGQVLAIPLFPIRIDVYPNASLELQYFIESPVLGDDPFTPEIEPSIPFSLGLWMKNNGGGTAGSVRIESAQPEIVETTSGGEPTEILIDFLLIGSQVNGEEISPSLNVDFGDILPGEVAIARWLMICSLQGEFVGYSATVESVNGFDDPEFSIIDAVDINRLEHVVQADEPTDDGIPDFLVDLESDPDDAPETVFLSSTAVEPVTAQYDAIVTTDPGALTATLDAGIVGGWRYIRIDDPYNSAYPLARVIRSDGKEIQLGTNAWQVNYIDRTTAEPEARRYVHIFDRGGDGEYTIEFDSDAEAPTIAAWQSVAAHGSLGEVGLEMTTASPASEPRGGLSKLVVTFTEPVDAATAIDASIALVGLDPNGDAIDPDVYTKTLTLRIGDQVADLEFDPPLVAGRYCIRLVGVTDQAGNLLEGDAARLDVAVLPGDATGDLRVNATDGGGISTLVGTNPIDPTEPWQVRSDLDHDGDIDLDDVQIVVDNRPQDFTWLINTCSFFESNGGLATDPRDRDGMIVRGANGLVNDALLGGGGSSDAASDRDARRKAFEAEHGATEDLLWLAGGEYVEAMVLLERIAVRFNGLELEPVSLLEDFGVVRGSVELLAVGDWWWGRLPEHLATATAHADLAAMLMAQGLEVSPVLVVGENEIALVAGEALVRFDTLIPQSWRDRVVATVSPGAIRSEHDQPGVDHVALRSRFGGDALADARAFGRRSDVTWAEADWRIIKLDPARASSFGRPPLDESLRNWRRQRADIDVDGDIDGADLDLIALAALGGGAPHRFDLNGDGAVDMGDFAWAAERLSLVSHP